jgi:hypothetical protein
MKQTAVEKVPTKLDSVLAKITYQNELGLSKLYEVVYYDNGKVYDRRFVNTGYGIDPTLKIDTVTLNDSDTPQSSDDDIDEDEDFNWDDDDLDNDDLELEEEQEI